MCMDKKYEVDQLRALMNMDYKYIEQLLERYWQCETSVEEESELRAFFSKGA